MADKLISEVDTIDEYTKNEDQKDYMVSNRIYFLHQCPASF